MSEIRKHYFLSEYCIIAEERGKRPSDFVSREEEQKKQVSTCVFCAGNEAKTPPASAGYKNGTLYFEEKAKRVQGWEIRCFPNLFPALSPSSAPLFPSGSLVVFPPVSPELALTQLAISGFGFHEVIVESPVHGKELEAFSDKELRLLMQVYRDRVAYYLEQDKIRSVSLFKNYGKAAGASLEHAHSQLLALPLLSPLLEREIQEIQNLNFCPYCSVFEKESRSERLILKNRDCIAFAPFCSKVPFEVWILPKKHVWSLEACSDALLFSLGTLLRALVLKYRQKLGGPAYNLFFQILKAPEYHLSLRLLPRLSLAAGFELNTGIYINSVSPEKAASYLRKK
ncbi:MAG: DUF4921 family protein [Methanosarcinaceae archaeon]|nr:DUF4921 family protein [Methanosarcinaceae archaeon]MDD4331184.1 DUF4921 family protein [Methanosarcinaceae archaeon]MDD4748693.1 DUF4921 family protein [Methanosarcinaceae archaeon]